MKKTFYLFCLTAAILASCSKEKNADPIAESVQTDLSDIKVISYNQGMKSGTTMLEFPSIDNYESTINLLSQRMDVYDSIFFVQYGSLSEDAYNSKMDEVGYNEQQPLIDFETSLRFSNSMRQAFVTVETSWLNQSDLDIATCPKKSYPFSIAEMSVLNANGEVKIGNSILKLTNDGFLWIKDGSFTTLSSFNNGDMSTLNLSTVVTNLNRANRSSCDNWEQRNIAHEYISNSKKVLKHVHFHSYPWKGTSSAEITSYKKNNNGNWKKHAIYLGVANQSYFKDIDCYASISSWSGWKHKTNKSIEKNISSWGAFPQYRAENGATVLGYFEYASNANNHWLTW